MTSVCEKIAFYQWLPTKLIYHGLLYENTNPGLGKWLNQ